MTEACPRFKIPHRTTIKRDIEDVYERAVLFLRNELKGISWCSLTTDNWTDGMNNRNYLGVTLHYVQQFKQLSCVIGLVQMEESHSSVNLAKTLESVLEFWGINKDRITTCVTDNAANIVKAVDLLIGKEKHVGCFAHTLNLTVNDTISDVTEFAVLLKKVKDIISYFHKSNIAAAKLEKLQREQGNAVLKLKQDVVTRWNSTYLMVTRFLQLKDPLSIVLQNVTDGPDMILGSELKILEDVQKVLKPFFTVTMEISAEKETTISKVIPLVGLMATALRNVIPLTPIGSALKKAAFLNMDKRFSKNEKTLSHAVATLLDPRFKKVDFKSAPCCAAAINFVNGELRKADAELARAVAIQPTVTSEGNDIDTDDLWANRRVSLTLNKNCTTGSANGLHTSLAVYLEAPVIPHDQDPLKIWESLKSNNASLASLAIKFLTSPATSVPAERLFSKAGLTLCKKRTLIKPQHLEKLMILQSLPMEVLMRL